MHLKQLDMVGEKLLSIGLFYIITGVLAHFWIPIEFEYGYVSNIMFICGFWAFVIGFLCKLLKWYIFK